MPPLQGSKVVPDRWAEHHRPAAEALLVDRGRLRHAGGTSAFDPVTGLRATAPPAAYFEGPCRVQVLAAQEARATVGGQQVSTVAYRVTVPVDVTEVAVDDVFTADACEADGSLIGRSLRVAAVARGSLIWQRDLTCIDDLG